MEGKQMNFDIIDTMVRTAMESLRNAYIEHGGIAAGACVLTSDGTLYSGCTVDHPLPNLNYSAEIVAMLRAIADGKRDFDAVAIVADIDGVYVPDDDTYQFLREFEVEEIILADLEGDVKIARLEELVPYRPRRKTY